MKTKIAIVSDVHYSSTIPNVGTRYTAIADTLLMKVIQRLNRFIKPDVALFLGDILDSGESPNADAEHKHLLDVFSKLNCKAIVMPGNHDADVSDFYSVLPNPGSMVDVNDVRFVIFHDPEEPDHNASRTAEDINRMRRAREGHTGPLISLQHVPLTKPGTSNSPFYYLNAKQVWDVFEEANYTLAISGHWHPGEDLTEVGGKSIVAPAICEDDFAFYVLEIDGDRITNYRHQLKLPTEMQLIDHHIHSQYAYCSANMDMATNVVIADAIGLGGMVFTEHSGQLYYKAEDYWGGKVMQQGIDTPGQHNRMDSYFADVQEFCPPAYFGSEIDCDFSGNPVIKPEDMAKLQVKMGAVHWIEEMQKEKPDMGQVTKEMLGRLERFLPCGIQILAHPLRIFKDLGEDIPEPLISGLIEVLRKNNTAAEINFHNQLTYPSFVRRCAEGGVKMVFGSDSHCLYEIGELSPHLALMEECGYNASNLDEILADIVPVYLGR